jgi:hypothetical protein
MIDMLRWLWNKLMKWGWDFNRKPEVELAVCPSARMGEPTVRINMSNAVNGRVLEIATQQQRSHDWDVEMYIVTEGESLHDAIATILLAKGMK